MIMGGKLKPIKFLFALVFLFLLSSNLILAAYDSGDLPTDSNSDGWYEISTCSQLQNINTTGLGLNYILTQDVDCSDTVNWNSGAGFVPIGNVTTAFSGQLNGNYFNIYNLTLYRPTGTQATSGFQALFGVTNGATISNLRLYNTNSTGIGYVACLVGQLNNSTVTRVGCNGGTITGNRDSSNNEGNQVAGLIAHTAYNSNTVSESFSFNEVIARRGQNGGFTGLINAPVSNSYSRSSVFEDYAFDGRTSGFGQGSTGGSCTNCYSAGQVTCAGGLCGGFTGEAYGGFTTTNTFYDQNLSGYTNTTGNTQPKTTAQMKTSQTFSSWDISCTADSANTIWKIDCAGENNNAGYPYLYWDGYYENYIPPIKITSVSFEESLPASLRVETSALMATMTFAYGTSSLNYNVTANPNDSIYITNLLGATDGDNNGVVYNYSLTVEDIIGNTAIQTGTFRVYYFSAADLIQLEPFALKFTVSTTDGTFSIPTGGYNGGVLGGAYDWLVQIDGGGAARYTGTGAANTGINLTGLSTGQHTIIIYPTTASPSRGWLSAFGFHSAITLSNLQANKNKVISVEQLPVYGFLPVSGVSTGNYFMSHLFYGCRYLTEANLVAGGDISGITTIGYYFNNYTFYYAGNSSSFTVPSYQVLSGWRPSNIGSSYFFYYTFGYSGATEPLDLSFMNDWNPTSISTYFLAYTHYYNTYLTKPIDLSPISDWNIPSIPNSFLAYTHSYNCYTNPGDNVCEVIDLSPLKNWRPSSIGTYFLAYTHNYNTYLKRSIDLTPLKDWSPSSIGTYFMHYLHYGNSRLNEIDWFMGWSGSQLMLNAKMYNVFGLAGASASPKVTAYLHSPTILTPYSSTYNSINLTDANVLKICVPADLIASYQASTLWSNITDSKFQDCLSESSKLKFYCDKTSLSLNNLWTVYINNLNINTIGFRKEPTEIYVDGVDKAEEFYSAYCGDR